MTEEQAIALRQAVRERRNIVIAGGTGTGKTTLANSLLQEMAQSGDRVLILDDVLTTGQATIDAITQARAAGLDVRQALVIVDRQEEGGRQRVEALGIPLTSLLTLQDLKDLRGKPGN